MVHDHAHAHSNILYQMYVSVDSVYNPVGDSGLAYTCT